MGNIHQHTLSILGKGSILVITCILSWRGIGGITLCCCGDLLIEPSTHLSILLSAPEISYKIAVAFLTIFRKLTHAGKDKDCIHVQ